MHGRIVKILLILVFCALQGCSAQNWYTGLRENQRQECYKRAGSAEVQDCLDRNGVDYDQYTRARQERLYGK